MGGLSPSDLNSDANVSADDGEIDTRPPHGFHSIRDTPERLGELEVERLTMVTD